MRTTVFVLALAACIVLGACGGQDGDRDGIAGTYVLDGDAMMPELEKVMAPMLAKIEGMLPEGASVPSAEEKAAKMKERKDKMLEDFTLELHLNDDGSFVAIDKGTTRARGTWDATGSAITFTTTEENGKPKDPPETIGGTLENGVLRFRPDKQMPFDLILKKQ